MRKSNRLVDSLFSKTRQSLLATLLLSPDKWWFLSDIAKHLGKTPSTLQRELSSLNESGILEKRIDGKRVYYRADAECPILKELQSLLLKTVGLVDEINFQLRSIYKNVEFAFIFGSIAKGEELSSSDVDLMIIGDIKLTDMALKLKKMEKKLLREINPVIYSISEFEKKLREKDHFLTSVVEEKKLFLKGKDEYLERVTIK